MTTKRLAPQARKLLVHMRKYKHITALQAADLYRIRSLPRRILDLKEAGVVIRTKLKTDKLHQRYAKYTYISEKQTT